MKRLVLKPSPEVYVKIPTLETPRLIIRAHTKNDFPALKAMWADPHVVKFISGIPSTEGQSWMRLMNYLGHWELMGYGYWAIIEKSTNTYIGDIGIADFKRDITPSISGIPEAGWVLSSAAHGKGYAHEALKAVLEWADSNLVHSKTVCIITKENERSNLLAEKCGYKKSVETVFNDKDVVIFSRPKATL